MSVMKLNDVGTLTADGRTLEVHKVAFGTFAGTVYRLAVLQNRESSALDTGDQGGGWDNQRFKAVWQATESSVAPCITRVVGDVSRTTTDFMSSRRVSTLHVRSRANSRRLISLNARRLFLPPELVTYVLVHELCHTKYLNHSPSFWRLVESYLPEYRQFDRQLRNGGECMPGWLTASCGRTDGKLRCQQEP
jgi:hypothetical protein